MAGKKQTPEIMSIEQLRQYLKIRHSTAKKLVESGEIKGRKIGVQWRVHKQAADNWLMGVDQ
jgi:excisionase family DNA binding protein